MSTAKEFQDWLNDFNNGNITDFRNNFKTKTDVTKFLLWLTEEYEVEYVEPEYLIKILRTI